VTVEEDNERWSFSEAGYRKAPDYKVAMLRNRGHQSFDRIWKRGIMSRGAAYHWLARQLRIPEHAAHFGNMTDPELIAEAIRVCDRCVGATVAQTDFEDVPIPEDRLERLLG